MWTVNSHGERPCLAAFFFSVFAQLLGDEGCLWHNQQGTCSVVRTKNLGPQRSFQRASLKTLKKWSLSIFGGLPWTRTVVGQLGMDQNWIPQNSASFPFQTTKMIRNMWSFPGLKSWPKSNSFPVGAKESLKRTFITTQFDVFFLTL